MLIGATDGIGLALARVYLRRGWRVGLMGRDPEKTDRVVRMLREEFPAAILAAVVCDVAEARTVAPAFDALVAQLGQTDLVIFCAGVMIDGDGVTCDFTADEAMLAANCLGAVNLLGLAANYFRAVGRGHLAAIGSIAGERGRRRNPAYNASKAALHTYLEGLRNRLHPYGVRVSTIKPGLVNTRMLLGRGKAPGAIEPEEAARHIVNALDRGRESFFVPFWWGAVAVLLRLCPRVLFKRFGPA